MSPHLMIVIKCLAGGLALAFGAVFVYGLIYGNCSGGDILALGALFVGAATCCGIVVSG